VPRAAIILIALALLLLVLHDAFDVMLLPRRVKSRLRIVRIFFHLTWWVWSAIARRTRSVNFRHNFLSLYGPLSMIGLLVVWAVGLIGAFGALYLGLGNHQTSLPSQLYLSGVTFFTLGYGDVLPHTAPQKLLAVIEAGLGFGFLATVIGYLPVLYQLFARREAKVIMLDAAAGSPPSAVTLLVRHAEGESLRELEDLLESWQLWSAELLESQLSYPMLAFYRSQHDNQSWLSALAAIMDCCALQMVGFKGVRTLRARFTFATARQALIEMGRVFHIGPRALDRDRLDSAQFASMRTALAASGLTFSEESDAEQRLAAFRSTYEPFLNGLAHYLLMTLPEWLADPEQVDNWQNSPRGRSAKQLIEAVAARPE
jgi:hypothetical protein